jgi:membrane protease YdiL (CAAX protease family)
MEFDIIDYVLTAIVVVIFPIWGVLDYRRFQRKAAEGAPNVRVNQYRQILAFEWIAAGIILAAWLAKGRGLASLGLGLEVGTWFWLGVGLTLAAVGGVISQVVLVMRSPEKLGEFREQFADLEPLLPHDRREVSWWRALSVTAGICEEVIYRGFLIAVFAAAMSTWAAVLLAAFIFGLNHAYQGPKGILKTGLVGLVLGGLFALTGSLWAPMLVHVVMDLAAGYVGRRAILLPTGGSPALAS